MNVCTIGLHVISVDPQQPPVSIESLLSPRCFFPPFFANLFVVTCDTSSANASLGLASQENQPAHLLRGGALKFCH